MAPVYVCGAFDDLRFKDYRFLDEAAKLGPLHVLLWSDEEVRAATGSAAKFPQSEREYTLQAVRYVHAFHVLADQTASETLPNITFPAIWAVPQSADNSAKRDFASRSGIEYRVISDSLLETVPPAPPTPDNPKSKRKKVVVTGCFDWFHSGHVRFFEEVAELGDLYVIVGHDENLRLLKGPGHPLFPAAQRRFIAGSIRYATAAVISTGHGWMDAEPEFVKIKPDIYAVNEDGDKPEKRAFCEKYNIEYRVLARLPKEGLPRRQSTALRGF